MGLIKSISGIRGTIGGKPGETLSPLDVVKFTAAYGTWLLQNSPGNKKIIIGRDGRISGEMIQRLVVSTLNALGFNVVDLGLSTTPTVEMSVLFDKAAGGIILTASHNPKEWNALKLLNSSGEFISAEDGTKILEIAASDNYTFAGVDKIGSYIADNNALQQHIDAVVNYPLVD
jgi:phosphomannomutase